MKKRPGSIGSSPNASPASEEAVNRFLVTVQGKLKQLEDKYISLAKQCKGQKTTSKDTDASFLDEAAYLQQLRALDEDKDKVETELNYLLKAKKTLAEASSSDTEAVQQVYADLSDALRSAQTQALNLLQGSEWAVRSRVSDIFTGLSDAVWTQVSLLRSRTEGREMKELLNEVVRLEQSKQVLDLQSEEFQESIRQKYTSRHHRDKRKIASLQSELARLQQLLHSERPQIRSSSTSLNVSLKASLPHPRFQRVSISPPMKKRVSESTEDLGITEKALLFSTTLSDISPNRKLRTSAVQTHLSDAENADLEGKLRTLAAASAKYIAKTRTLLGKRRDVQAEDALESLTQALNSVSVESSVDLERSGLSLRDKSTVEHTNSLLEKENLRLTSLLTEVQRRYRHLSESLERLQQSPGVKRQSQDSARVKDLEFALETERKQNQKLKNEHKTALEDLIKDCTELTSEVKLLSEEKEQLLTDLESKNKLFDLERGRNRLSTRSLRQILQENDHFCSDKLRFLDNRVLILHRKIDHLGIKLPLAVSRISTRFSALQKSILREKNQANEGKKDNERLKTALLEVNKTSEQLLNELKSQSMEMKKITGEINTCEAKLKEKDEILKEKMKEIENLKGKIEEINREKFDFDRKRSENPVISPAEIAENPLETSFSFENPSNPLLEENLASEQPVLEVQNQELEAEIVNLREKIALMETIMATLRGEKENMLTQASIIQSNFGKLERELGEIVKNKENLQEENEKLKEQVEKFNLFLTEQKQSQMANLKKAENRENELKNEIERLKKAENSAILREEALKRDLKNSEETIERLEAAAESLKIDGNTHNSEQISTIKSLRSQISQLEASLKDQIQASKRLSSKFEGEISEKDREIESLSLEKDRIESEIGQMKALLEAKYRENQQFRENIQSLTLSNRQLTLDFQDKDDELSLFKSQNSALERKIEEISGKMQDIRLETAQKTADMSQERQNQRNQGLLLAEKLQETEEKCALLREKVENMEILVKKAELEINRKNEEIKNAENEKKSLESQLKSMISELKQSENAVKSGNDAYEALNKQYLSLHSVLGPLSPSDLPSKLLRERIFSENFPIWTQEIDLKLSEGDFEVSIRRFTEGLEGLMKEKQSLERNLNGVLESTAQGGDSGVELRLEVEKLQGKVEGQGREIEQLRLERRRLDREREGLEQKLADLQAETGFKSTQIASLEAELVGLKQTTADFHRLEDSLRQQLAAKVQEIAALHEVLSSSGEDSAESPGLDFAEEIIAPASPGSENSLKEQLRGLVQRTVGPGSVVKVVKHEGQVWNLVYVGEKRYSWVIPKELKPTDSIEDAEDQMRRMEFELMKQQQTLSRAADMLRPHTPRHFPDLLQAIDYVTTRLTSHPRGVSAQLPSQDPLPKLPISGLRDSQDLLDTPRVMTNREKSSSMERQFQLIDQGTPHSGVKKHDKVAILEESNSFEKGRGIVDRAPHSFGLSDSSVEGNTRQKDAKGKWENEANRLQAEVTDRDEKLRMDAQQIIVLQTDNLRLKTDLQEYENTVNRLEEQLKLKKEELGRVSAQKKTESAMSLSMIRNSVLRLVAELPPLQREVEEIIKTLFPLLGLTGTQIEVTEQARKAPKGRKISLLGQVMT